MSQRYVPLDRLPALGPNAGGLGAAQVEVQRIHGFNDIVAQAASGWLVVARNTARDPMLWFLLLTAGLFGLLGQVTESLTLLVAMAPLLGMDAYLHRRTNASSAGLASRLASSARVLRDGQWRAIPARELVPGDLVEVAPGEYFPADGLLVSGNGLQVDESTLTGESLPVAKQTIEPAAPLPASASEEHWGTAGTRLLTGKAWLRIVCIGSETRYGEIVRSATEGSHAPTPLQKAIGELVAVLLGMAIVMCIVLAAIRLWHGHGWIDALLSAVTLAVAALPEEFPVVYTFFLGVGVYRLARKKALVRRAVAVENIGRVTCIVSDKTGTITAGSLVLAHRAPADGEDEASVLQVATFAARPDSGDPLDQALHAAAGQLPQAARVADFPFTEARRRETVIWRLAAGDPTAFTKGAPETVLATCELSQPERAKWLARVEAYARSGHKVIACARREMPAGMPTGVEPEAGFAFTGLLAFEDPVRDGVREAMADCMAAGMRVIMVTGDHPATAAAIAREIGLGGAEPKVVVLAPGDDAGAVLGANGGAHVVARATPAQKLALVQALQAEGELVAVTGDGVNDVPALRLADVGVAMGERGTRSAREVAPVVLLDDNFRTIVDAVAEGRQLFQNLRLAFAYLLLVHLPLVIGAAAIPLMGLPLLFLPIHIVWLELVIHPTAMLAFQDLPGLGPLAPVRRHRRARFFSTEGWLGIGLVGGLMSVAVVWSYLHALGADRDVEHARAMALTVLLAASAAITTGLTKLRQATARWLVVGTLASLGMLVQIPVASRLLNLRPLHGDDWAMVAIAFAVVGMATLGLASRLRHHPD
ncbi:MULTISPECIES: cation-transporting P-type ATPase [unclassified Variovorax]|uniref:cation-translocating P-type ATPase n=1 Tax=unclassified Variovorax TaxID=663243 RepID=UPI000C9C0055|nr:MULTISPECIES: cation-transporting P-type ATPase [unclassified Variovorax]PNG52339.1 Calcium-transporting ATPase 1 [Variovorax sp. B4]PNG54879.1 Calcium-transporting ATPase 1 [Variovorax sp. B2]VTV15891.1 Calcium-transporting ATPase [Variovorax sp. WDL1]